MAKKKTTTIEVFTEDKDKILELANLLHDEMGVFVGQRMAVMIAVHKLIEEKKYGSTDA